MEEHYQIPTIGQCYPDTKTGPNLHILHNEQKTKSAFTMLFFPSELAGLLEESVHINGKRLDCFLTIFIDI